MNLTFQPVKMFAKLDKDQDGLISADDLIAYMKDKYIKLTPGDAEMVLHEYDADEDGSLNFEEYCQFALPATNKSLRDVALARGQRYYYSSTREISFEAENN